MYDVNVKYQQQGKWKTHVKKGFATKKEAVQYEAEMRTKLASPSYSPIDMVKGKQTVQEYMGTWIEQHGKANLRPSTFDGYKSYIRNHIVPHIGYVQLRALTPAMLDEMFQKMFDEGLSQSSVRYTQRILSVALESARKYRYIDHNPARDILTKFGKQGKTPDPYTIPQMQRLFGLLTGTEWEMIVMLAGMYGMRMSEILGLRWRNVDLDKGCFSVVEQLPFKIPAGTTEASDMATVKGKGQTVRESVYSLLVWQKSTLKGNWNFKSVNEVLQGTAAESTMKTTWSTQSLTARPTAGTSYPQILPS